jgi:hypothetical protein
MEQVCNVRSSRETTRGKEASQQQPLQKGPFPLWEIWVRSLMHLYGQ